MKGFKFCRHQHLKQLETSSLFRRDEANEIRVLWGAAETARGAVEKDFDVNRLVGQKLFHDIACAIT